MSNLFNISEKGLQIISDYITQKIRTRKNKYDKRRKASKNAKKSN